MSIPPLGTRLCSDRWQPVAVGHRAHRVEAALHKIAAEIVHFPVREQPEPARKKTPFLADGLAGTAMFLHCYSRCFASEQADAAAIALLNDAIDAIADLDATPGLFTGVAGVAFVADLIQSGRRTTSDDEDELAEFDTLLAEAVLTGESWVPFDLIDGLAGVAVYALRRRHRRAASLSAERILERICAQRVQTSNGVAWKTPTHLVPARAADTFEVDAFPVGVSHGLAGVLGVLSRGCREYPENALLRRTLEASATFLLGHTINDESLGCFPRLAKESGCESEAASDNSWCWGDPGTAAVLLKAGILTGRDDWSISAIKAAMHAGSRIQTRKPYFDVSLCHGMAGQAHIYNRLFQSTGVEAFKETAIFWADEILKEAIHPDAIGGLHFKLMKGPGQPFMGTSAGFLTGAAGVGLTLLSMLSADPPEWDAVLLLDG